MTLHLGGEFPSPQISKTGSWILEGAVSIATTLTARKISAGREESECLAALISAPPGGASELWRANLFLVPVGLRRYRLLLLLLHQSSAEETRARARRSQTEEEAERRVTCFGQALF